MARSGKFRISRWFQRWFMHAFFLWFHPVALANKSCWSRVIFSWSPHVSWTLGWLNCRWPSKECDGTVDPVRHGEPALQGQRCERVNHGQPIPKNSGMRIPNDWSLQGEFNAVRICPQNVCTQVYLHRCMRIHIDIHRYVYYIWSKIYIYIYIYHTYIYIYIHIYIHIYINIPIYIYIHIHIYIYIYVYIHIRYIFVYVICIYNFPYM